jgi:diguanylate cyclase (GGDEF)-like protein
MRLGMRLLFQFGVASLVPVIAIGVVVGNQIRRSIEERALDTYANASQSAVQVISKQSLEGPGRAGVSDVANELEPTFGSMASLADPASLIRVVDLFGRVQYSSVKGEQGTRAKPNRERSKALAGESRSRWLATDKVTNATKGVQYFSMTLPLNVGAVPMATIEVVAADPVLSERIGNDVGKTLRLLALGLAALWLCLVPIVWKIARRLSKQAEENELLALHDPLTELPNRLYLLRRGAEAIAGPGRTGILLIDLDNFKDVNDTLGHASGDLLLVHVANVLKSLTGDRDVASRLGGDEFAVLLPNISDEHELFDAADRIKSALEQATPIDGIMVSAVSSIGMAITPDHGTSIAELFQRADSAMYASKERSSVPVAYSSDMDKQNAGRLEMAADLRAALASADEITVAIQPIVDARFGEPVAAEVLCRWTSPTRGPVSPIEFIGLAERSGLIRALTDKVVDLTARQLAEWNQRGLRIPVSLNLSAKSLSEQDLPERLVSAFGRYGIEPSQITLEMTESGLINETAEVLELVHRLRRVGFHLALDDFGTGYSSLTYLRTLQADVLKIDRSFVQQIAENRGDAEIVSAVIAMAHGLHMVVVAEGVETEEQWQLLGQLGCDRLQGYYFSRPVPGMDIDVQRFGRTLAPATFL